MSILFSSLRYLLAATTMLVSVVSFSLYTVTASAAESVAAPKSSQVQQKPVQKTVNINADNAETLSAGLSGIGLKKAEAIVAYRKRKGNFTSVDQLTEVKGIGSATVAKNRDRIKL